MSTRLRLLLLWLVLAGVAVDAKPAEAGKPERDGFHLSDLLPRSLQRNPRLHISVLTELTAEGKAVTAPDPAHPAYYAAWDGGLVEAGDIVAGETPPRKERLEEVMRRALAASGYLPATAEHPPTIVIHYRWGSYNHLTSLPPAEAAATSQEPDNQPVSASVDVPPGDDLDDPAVRKNLIARAALVGGVDFARGLIKAADQRLIDQFRLQDSRNDDLVELALGDLYFVIAVGYDAAEARQGKARRLWTTKISTNSQGVAMDEALPALVTTGRKIFGHETNGAVLATPRLFEGRVEIGEAVVVPDASTARPAPTRK
jgi:hypothetical protein